MCQWQQWLMRHESTLMVCIVTVQCSSQRKQAAAAFTTATTTANTTTKDATVINAAPYQTTETSALGKIEVQN
jgi:hypothetical protein